MEEEAPAALTEPQLAMFATMQIFPRLYTSWLARPQHGTHTAVSGEAWKLSACGSLVLAARQCLRLASVCAGSE